MFALFKTKKLFGQEAQNIYGTLLERTRKPVFYKTLGVEDSFEGRFEVLALHVCMVMHVMLSEEQGEVFNQALFDVMFADMDQSLREMGKGDMGVPKYMRRLMKGFNGRVHVYHDAFDGGEELLSLALKRNVYAERDNVPVKDLVDYVSQMLDHLRSQRQDIVKGRVLLP